MLFVFGQFVLDTNRRELRFMDRPRLLEPQVFDVLEHLIRNRERVVSKDELLAAVWTGKVVSDATLASRISAARAAIADNGEDQRLIRTMPRKGVRFIAAVQELPDPVAAAPGMVSPAAGVAPLALPDKPSIAVLPFQNLSDDRNQEYFADGVVEEIITALSRLRWLFVIARNSSFAYRGRAADAKQVGRELGVRYIVEGSVRRAAHRIRITGQLIDTETGAHLWAERFEGRDDDVFDLQDRVTESLVGALSPTLEVAEIERARRKPTESLDAYDYYLRGQASVHRGTRESSSEALRMYYRAFELDDEFSSAYGMAAFCYDMRKWNGWMADPIHEKSETERLSRHAAELGKGDAVALCTGGFALAHVVGELDEGAAHIERALRLNTNLALAWHLSGWVAAYRGDTELAIEQVSRAIRLSPLDPLLNLAQGAISFAHFVAGRYDDAIAWGHKAVRERPNFAPMNRLLAASLSMAGKLDESRKVMAQVRRLDPKFRMADVASTTPLRRSEDLARYVRGLELAGLPD